MSLEARQHTQSAHQGWKGGRGEYAKGRGKKNTTNTGLEVITVLCTQNNWSHQCGCHMESLALPRHRCSPFSGQNPPIKPKLVAKRPLTPPILLPWVRMILQHLHSSKSSAQFEGNKDRQDSQCPEDAAFFRYSHPLSPRVETTWPAHLQLNWMWQRMQSGKDSLLFQKSQPLVLLLLFNIQRCPRALKTY